MCDYSLHLVANRPAKVGDTIRSTRFAGTSTRGFAAADRPDMAVCLLPGTEVAFAGDIRYDGVLGLWQRIGPRVARFVQMNLDLPQAQHDALEFPDGTSVSLQRLASGQIATVLQLPSQRDSEPSRPREPLHEPQTPTRPVPETHPVQLAR